MNSNKLISIVSLALLAALGQSIAQAHTVQPPACKDNDQQMSLSEHGNAHDSVFGSPFAQRDRHSQRGDDSQSSHEESTHGWNTYAHHRDTWNDDGTFTDALGKHDHDFKGNWPHGLTHPFGRPSCEVNAVPVPAAAWLLGSGLVALTGLARRRRS